MTNRKAVLAALLSVTAFAADTTLPNREGLVAHEWGTFTSVAAPDGTPVVWAPPISPGDLPCFVNRLRQQSPKYSPALIRMETPVVYFYPARPMTVSVGVDFPEGNITEWYPKASRVLPEALNGNLLGGRIEWSNVELTPGDQAELPVTAAPNHYFAARETDASLLRVGDQREKLLFYRGVGNFTPPIEPKFSADGTIEVRTKAARAFPLVMLFENYQGRTGYRIARDAGKQITFEAPELSPDASDVRQQLVAALEGAGLYRREALAMVETWKDSWFEEGMRLIYILPQTVVDKVLPLKISPAPSETARVFVGRVEMLSPHVNQTIETAVSAGDVQTLAQMRRFLSPFEQLLRLSSRTVGSMEGHRVLSLANAEIYKALKLGSCVE